MDRKIKVLIADDEVLVRIGIIHAVQWEKHGFEIVGEAADGESCLQMAERLKPDLIVLDINMPGMNGIEALQRLKRQGWNGKVIVLTCYDDFSFVREALRAGASDYVLKSNLNESGLLEAVLRLNYDMTDKQDPVPDAGGTDRVLRQILDGLSWERGGDLHFSSSCFCAIAGKIRDLEKVRERYQAKGMDFFYRSLHSLMKQVLQQFPEYEILQYDKALVGVFLSVSHLTSVQECSQRVRELAFRMHTVLQEYLELDVGFGSSRFLSGADNIEKAWSQACRMLDMDFFEKKVFSCYDELRRAPYSEEESLRRLAELETSLKEIIVDKRVRELREGFQAYFEFLRKEKRIEPSRIKTFCQDAVKLMQAQEKNWEQETLPDEIGREDTLEGTETLIYAYLEEIAPEGNDQGSHWLVHKATDYIQQNYSQDLNLSVIAQYLELSESYTSRIFNKYMQMNIPAYVNHIRIERAKELLRNSNKKIYEIAAEIGYASPTAFHLAFKKQEGLTPVEFRNQTGQK